MSHVFPPPAIASVPVAGSADRFPVHRIYCVGRNYVEHAVEMGFTGREPPFFFLKAANRRSSFSSPPTRCFRSPRANSVGCRIRA